MRKGSYHTEESKRKIHESVKKQYKKNPQFSKVGEKSYWFGKYHSEETKRKMKEAHQGKSPKKRWKLSEETRKKRANPIKEKFLGAKVNLPQKRQKRN